MVTKNKKQNVKSGRKPNYQVQAFTSHPLLAVLDMAQLRERARQHGKRMRELKDQERKARLAHKSYRVYIEEFYRQRQWLREVQRAYRKRLELRKMRGLS